MRRVIFVLLLFFLISLLSGCKSTDNNEINDVATKEVQEAKKGESTQSSTGVKKEEKHNEVAESSENIEEERIENIDNDKEKMLDTTNNTEIQQLSVAVEADPHKLMIFDQRIPKSSLEDEDEYEQHTYLYDLNEYKVITEAENGRILRNSDGRMLLIDANDDLCIFDVDDKNIKKVIIDSDVISFQANRDYSKIVYEKKANDTGLYKGPDISEYVDFCGLYYYDSVKNDKIYIGDMTESHDFSRGNFLASRDLDMVYYLNIKMNLCEWNIDSGTRIVDEGDFYYSSFFYCRRIPPLMDEYDNLYYLREENGKYNIYKKERNSNPVLLMPDIDLYYSVYDDETQKMYLLKRYKSHTYNIPSIMQADRFEEILAQLEELEGEKTAANVKSRFKKWDINNLAKADAERIDAMVERYPSVLNEVIYTLRDGLSPVAMNKLEKAFDSIGFSIENETLLQENEPIYREGFEIYYFDPVASKPELIDKTITTDDIDRISDVPFFAIGYDDIDEFEDEYSVLLVNGRKINFNKRIDFRGIIQNYIDTDYFRFFYEDKIYTINGILGTEKLTYTVEDAQNGFSEFTGNRIEVGEYQSIIYEWEGYELMFDIGRELYVNGKEVDNGVIDQYFDYSQKDRIERNDHFIYIKRISDLNYELSWYNSVHKNALMYYDEGVVTEICRDVSRPVLFGNQIIFVKRYPDEEYLGDLCIWDKDTKNIKVIASNVLSFYTRMTQ